MNKTLITVGTAVCRLIGQFTNKNIHINKNSLPPVPTMVKFAKMHSIETMLYAGLKESGFTDDELGDLPEQAELLSFCQIKNDAFAARLSANFSNAGIEHMIIKGIEFSKYYPPKLLRTSTDIDFYMSGKDAERVARGLEERGFTRIEDDCTVIALAKKPCSHIEIHTGFNAVNKKQSKFYADLLKNALYKNNSRRYFSEENNLLFALLHLYKHFSKSGAGVRMLLDIYLIQKKCIFDIESIQKKTADLGIDKFFNSVCEISDYLFEGKSLDNRMLPALEFFFSSGTFGTNNAYLTINAAKYNGKTSKIKNYLKSEAGFSNENIKNKYPLAKKFPMLLPYFHVHRVVSGFIHKGKSVGRVITDSKVVTSDNAGKQLIEVMELMGIN